MVVWSLLQGGSPAQHQVAPFPAVRAPAAAGDATTTGFLREYYRSIRDWGRVAQRKVVPVPDKASSLYLGLPRNVENDVRPTAYTAMVLAFLAETAPPDASGPAIDRSAAREAAIGLLRYLAHGHVANGGACVNGKPWGKQWQSAMWARVACFAGWQVWTHLTPELRRALLEVLVFEADRFLRSRPKSSVRNDTGAEENAWNASICSLACNMLPRHARAAAWETAAKRFMYNTFSVRADARDGTLGDDGISIKEWVTTVNAHDDFTVENHGLVHVGYLKTSACMLQENAVHWLMAGRTVPHACSHHVAEVFRVLRACMGSAGSAIYFAGNDWRIYNTQCSDILLYCMLSRLHGDTHAAYLEQTALRHLRARQELEGGFYNGRRDLEYGGVCATRLIGCYHAHVSRERSTAAATQAEFDAGANGVLFLKSAKTLLHRTDAKFASFTWADNRMGLTLPVGPPTVWPHLSSYLGTIDGKGTTGRHARLLRIHAAPRADGFVVWGTLARCEGKLTHDFWFASPREGYTVYVERLVASSGFRVTDRETGAIGLNPPPGQNDTLLTGAFGERRIRGRGGDEGTLQLESDWLNVGGSIGYCVLRPDGGPNLIRFHDHADFHPRRPHLQEWVSLIGDRDARPGWACVVTFPNIGAAETRAKLPKIRFAVKESGATVRVGEAEYELDFGG